MAHKAGRAQKRVLSGCDTFMDTAPSQSTPSTSPSSPSTIGHRAASPSLQILLVEDSEIFAYGLANLLRQDPAIHSVDIVADVETALTQVKENPPDVAIVGLRLRGRVGDRRPREEEALHLLRILGQEHPRIRTMTLARDIRPVIFRQLVELKVHACLERDSPAERILAVIWAVAHGLVVMEWEQLAWLEAKINQPNLTERELEVLVLAAEGLTDRQIAYRLGCSPKTASKHLEKIRAKLGVDSRHRAIAEARRLGILA